MKPLLQLAGIDISARSLTVVVEQPGGDRERLAFTNDTTGHRHLIRRLSKQGWHARVALEASGIYSLDAAATSRVRSSSTCLRRLDFEESI
ncbi:MAG TPA: hypothetical protein VF121_16920 [Thermoanaerobaculia bacterium]|nr:hypothetical protein [Thermoanaerobaculia bacterium]